MHLERRLDHVQGTSLGAGAAFDGERYRVYLNEVSLLECVSPLGHYKVY